MKKELKQFIENFFNNRKDIQNNKVSNEPKLIKEDLIKKYDLDLKQEDFFDWADENMSCYSKDFLKKFVEKMAIWYEFRYTDRELENIFDEKDSFESITDIINKSEAYKDLMFFSQDEAFLNNNLSNTLWSDLFNMKAFLNTLSVNEKRLLERPKMHSCFSISNININVNLSSKGIITDIYFFRPYNKLSDEKILSFLNKPISKLLEYLKEKNMLTEDDLFWYNQYQKSLCFKERLLDSVMYRIIQRGGDKKGAMLGFLFALEFNRNLDIPLMYHNPRYMNNRFLLNEYLKRGGDKNLICPRGYTYQNIEEVKLIDWYNEFSYNYTKEELELYKRLLQLLSGKVEGNKDEFIKELNLRDKEEINNKRLEKRLLKSINR